MRRELLTNDRQANPPAMRVAAMFEQENSLPRAKVHFSFDDRHCFAGAGQNHPDMRWHVVRPLIVMFIVRVFRDEVFEESFHVPPSRGSGVLHGR